MNRCGRMRAVAAECRDGFRRVGIEQRVGRVKPTVLPCYTATGLLMICTAETKPNPNPSTSHNQNPESLTILTLLNHNF